ncbi:DUF1376 domain-containing protein [Pseudomonas syringae]|nr:DUF1376 domain-containing protein [Pseudomonas syringae]
MAALPYIQLYVADYLADTMHLTTEEHGAYLLLIFNYWQTGKPIPTNRLARISRLSNERWTDVERSLREFFNERSNEWVHDRIERDLEAVRATQEQRIAAGKASAEARKQAGKARKPRGANARSTPVEIPLNENPTNKEEKRRDTDIEETPPPPREDDFPPSPLDLDTRDRFPMSTTWEPNPKTFPAVLMQLGIPGTPVDRDQFLEFRSYWHATPDEHRTQAKWEHALASHLKRNITQPAGKAHAHNGSGQTQGPGQGQRAGNGGRKLSAPEQVRAAIAERDAREAAANPAGQPLDQDDRDVRAPLDGEFRRVT